MCPWAKTATVAPEPGSPGRHRQDLGDDAVGAGADLGRRLAAGAAVGPQRPVGAIDVDVGARPPLVVAVVPLEQVVAKLRPVAEAGELAGLPGAAERAAEDAVELDGGERLAEPARLLLALRRSAGCRCGRCAAATCSTPSRHGGRARRRVHGALAGPDAGPLTPSSGDALGRRGGLGVEALGDPARVAGGVAGGDGVAHRAAPSAPDRPPARRRWRAERRRSPAPSPGRRRRRCRCRRRGSRAPRPPRR